MPVKTTTALVPQVGALVIAGELAQFLFANPTTEETDAIACGAVASALSFVVALAADWLARSQLGKSFALACVAAIVGGVASGYLVAECSTPPFRAIAIGAAIGFLFGVHGPALLPKIGDKATAIITAVVAKYTPKGKK